MEIGDKIKLLREQKGYTQQNVAQILRVDQAQYCRIENNHFLPSLYDVKMLCELFQVSADYLLDINITETIKIRQAELFVGIINLLEEEVKKYR